MKILFIGFSLSKTRREGVKNHIYDLAENLVKKGVDVVVVTNSDHHNCEKVLGFKLYEVKCGTSVYQFIIGFKQFIDNLLEIIDKEKPNIVHDHFVLPGTSLIITAPLIRRFKKANIKFVKTAYNKSLSINNIHSILIPFNVRYLIYEGVIRLTLNNVFIDRLVYQKFNSVIFHSTDIGDEWYALSKEIFLKYIPLGITLNKNKAINPKKPSKKVIISYLGHPSFKKGLDVFLESLNLILNEIPNSEGWLAISSTAEGKDRYSKKIIKLKKHFKSRIKSLGTVDPFEFYQQSSVMVFPLLHDWSAIAPPLSVLEALSMGSLVVASPVCGIKDLVKDNQNGYLLERNTSDEITNKVKYLTSRKSLELIKRKALQEARKNSWELVVNDYINLYQTLIH